MTYQNHLLKRDDFPQLLAEIPDAPKQIFIRGTLPSHDNYAFLCVVGSRAASPYGRRACASLIAGLAGAPVCIISGLALGIDACAHEAALAAGLKTVAVLPSSNDDATIYPSTNRPLAQRILQACGALVSEYEDGSKAEKWTFPARNRIMAGLSHATLIIEASEKSGTQITARLALDYNRDVLCVPHPIGVESGAGGNRLIREGATLVRDSADILDALGLQHTTQPNSENLPADLTDAERALMLALTEPLSRDEIISRTSLQTRDANIALSSLSIRGLITERMDKVERV